MNLTYYMSVFGRQIGLSLLPYNRITPIYLLGARHLYTQEALGVDTYVRVRERIQAQFNEMGDRFRTKMREFVAPKSVHMVFTEDLKHMLHLTDGSEEDMELIEDMLLKFNKQNKDLRFGNFIFGPVIMRMYYYLNKPKEALKIFLNPDTEGLFNQVISFQLLMDLLLKNEMYDEVMQVADIVKDMQLPNARFPRSVVVLAMAAAYKKNTPESLEYMKRLWADLQEAGHEPMRRAITFAAALAINQQAPHIALELLSQVPRQNYVTVRNLKVSALADVNRVDDALPILRSVLEMEGPQENKHSFCADVIDKIASAVENTNKKDVQQEFQRISSQLKQMDHISDVSLDSVLCTEVEKFNARPERGTRERIMAKFDESRGDSRMGGGYQNYRRKSLSEME